MNRQPVRVIVYAWGKSYVDRMLNNAVASLLAPGNLPALSGFFDCTLIVVTEEKLFGYVDTHHLIRWAKSLCQVRLISLDDLIGEPWQYGISLAHALFRGFSELGAAMTQTYLLFLNADFVLADGCYERLIPHMERGELVLLSPSYCVVEEEVEPILEEISDSRRRALVLPPRQLARIIIDNRHNTIRAKTINQQQVHFEYMDQAYWKIDDDTIIAHQMPISVVAMRPETALTDINTFWDWGIVYEFCPSRRLTVLDDSDEFLMLELRNEAAHRDLVRPGPTNPQTAAAGMRGYITQYQLDNARFGLTLHAQALPPAIDEARASLRAFFDELLRQLQGHVPDHRNHPQWIYHRWHLSRHIAASKLRNEIASLAESSYKAQARTAKMQTGVLMMLAATKTSRFAAIRGQCGDGIADMPAAAAVEQGRGADDALLAIAEEFVRDAELLEPIFEEWARSAGHYQVQDASLRRQLRLIEERRVLTWADLGFCGVPGTRPTSSEPEGPKPGIWTRRRWIKILKGARAWTLGSVPHTRRWHPLHFICKDISRVLDGAAHASGPLLFVSGDNSIATRWVDPVRRRHLRVSAAGVLEGALDGLASSVQFDFCFVELDSESFPRIRDVHRILADRVIPGGGIVICWINSACQSAETLQQAFGDCAAMQSQGAAVRFYSSVSGWGGLAAARAASEQTRLRRLTRLGAGLMTNILDFGRRRPIEGPTPLPYCWGAIIEIGVYGRAGIASQHLSPAAMVNPSTQSAQMGASL